MSVIKIGRPPGATNSKRELFAEKRTAIAMAGEVDRMASASARTAKLRELRLAREAAEREAAKPTKPK